MKTNKLWAIVVFFAGLLEFIGIKSKKKDDTLSEYVWSKTKHPLTAAGVGGLVAWLVYHFTFGFGQDLGIIDLAFTGVGLVFGYFSRVPKRK